MTSEGAIGIIAGNGILPLDIVNTASKKRNVFVVAHRNETDPAIAQNAAAISWIRVGQIGKSIRFFLSHGVKEVIFAGGISKKKLFKNFRPDAVGIKIMAKALTSQDDAVLSLICKTYEEAGIAVHSLERILPDYVPQAGVLTNSTFSKADYADIAMGVKAARTLGSLDIGQAVVVAKGSVVAVEAVEGTAALLERVHQLEIKGGILVKVPKPMQDERIDLPSIGVETIQSLRQSEGKGIVLEAGKTVLLRPTEVVALANKSNIAILIMSKEEIEQYSSQ